MSRLTIRNEAQRDKSSQFHTGEAFSAYGTTVDLDGQRLKSCRSVDLHVAVDDLVTAKVDVIATDALDVEIDAQVTLNVAVVDGFDLEETTLANGGRRLRAVPR